jgi:hypothetical protein
MVDEYGAFGVMRIGKANRISRRKPAPMSLCPPQIPHGLTWGWTWAAAVGSQWLTAWAMARPCVVPIIIMVSCCLCCGCCTLHSYTVPLGRKESNTPIRKIKLNTALRVFGKYSVGISAGTETMKLSWFSSTPPGKCKDISRFGRHRVLSDPFHFIKQSTILRCAVQMLTSSWIVPRWAVKL